jgi:hypothetical protein
LELLNEAERKGTLKINRHINQIDSDADKYSLDTPIYSFLPLAKKNIDKKHSPDWNPKDKAK